MNTISSIFCTRSILNPYLYTQFRHEREIRHEDLLCFGIDRKCTILIQSISEVQCKLVMSSDLYSLHTTPVLATDRFRLLDWTKIWLWDVCTYAPTYCDEFLSWQTISFESNSNIILLYYFKNTLIVNAIYESIDVSCKEAIRLCCASDYINCSQNM